MPTGQGLKGETEELFGAPPLGRDLTARIIQALLILGTRTVVYCSSQPVWGVYYSSKVDGRIEQKSFILTHYVLTCELSTVQW